MEFGTQAPSRIILVMLVSLGIAITTTIIRGMFEKLGTIWTEKAHFYK